MIPNASEIFRRRQTVCTIVRAAALIVALFGLWPIFAWIDEGLRDGDLTDFDYYLPQLIFAALFPVFGGLVLLFQRLITSFLVPIRRSVVCPACRHRIEGLAEPRCTECGLELTPEFLDPEASRNTRIDRPAQVQRWREIVASCFRGVGMIFAVFTGFVWLVFIAVLILWLIGSEESVFDGEAEVIDVTLNLCWMTAVTMVFLFRAPWVARVVVPFPAGERGWVKGGADASEAETPEPSVRPAD